MAFIEETAALKEARKKEKAWAPDQRTWGTEKEGERRRKRAAEEKKKFSPRLDFGTSLDWGKEGGRKKVTAAARENEGRTEALKLENIFAIQPLASYLAMSCL